LSELCGRLPWPLPQPMNNAIMSTGWPLALDNHLAKVKAMQLEELDISVDLLFKSP
jgi:membrane protein